jgi:hypothetical protein
LGFQLGSAYFQPSTASLQPTAGFFQLGSAFFQLSAGRFQPGTANVQRCSVNVQLAAANLQPICAEFQLVNAAFQRATANFQPPFAGIQRTHAWLQTATAAPPRVSGGLQSPSPTFCPFEGVDAAKPEADRTKPPFVRAVAACLRAHAASRVSKFH